MSSCHFEAAAAANRGTPGAERSVCGTRQVPLTADFATALAKSSPRFGSLSHHSFFSRHNPHPNRVRHIQGLNGRPICSVRDDWFVSSSLFPHPLLKSHVLRNAAQPAPPAHAQSRAPGNRSEAWRDELKELAAKVSLTSQEKKAQKVESSQAPLERSKTQYSAATGRIIPPRTKSSWRRSNSQQLKHPLPFQDQELMVFELLCQILQTDSLSSVQQWLLLAGQREKDVVMGMISQALDGVDVSGRHQQIQALHPCASSPAFVPSSDRPWRKPGNTGSHHVDQPLGVVKPEMIGDAEVLEVHATTPLEED